MANLHPSILYDAYIYDQSTVNTPNHSTVVDADRIIVLSGGRIREEGTHTELLALGGLYKSLVERQLREEVVRNESGIVN